MLRSRDPSVTFLIIGSSVANAMIFFILQVFMVADVE